MNKKIKFSILIVILLMSIKPCIAQKKADEYPPVDLTTKDYKYEEVVVLKDNVSKRELFTMAKAALTTLFNSETNIIQSEDTAQGFIVAKVYSNMPKIALGTVQDAKLLYTITIQVKDRKYRYSIDNLIYKYVKIQYSNSPTTVGYISSQSSSSEESPLITINIPFYSNKIRREANTEIKNKIEALKFAMETGSSGNLKKDW